VGLLSVLKIKQSLKLLVRDFGLLALGLPINQIKNLTGRKAETIHRTLARCRDEPDLWDSICVSLQEDYDFVENEIDRLEKLSKGKKGNGSPFQSAFGKRMDSSGPDRQRLKEREVLRVWIERLIGGEVGYASTGEFWRADVDVEKNPWIRKIRAGHEIKIDADMLGNLFHAIAIQIRNPNKQAQTLAHQRPTAPLMTLSCLCDGMVVKYGHGEAPVHLPEFMDGLKAITRVLGN
jgi:hypothetical protein